MFLLVRSFEIELFTPTKEDPRLLVNLINAANHLNHKRFFAQTALFFAFRAQDAMKDKENGVAKFDAMFAITDRMAKEQEDAIREKFKWTPEDETAEDGNDDGDDATPVQID